MEENRRSKILLLCVLLAGCVVTGIIMGHKGGNDESSGATRIEQAWEEEKAAPLIKVYVSGAVASPGLYDLEPGSRGEDAVNAAGGVLPAADMQRVNLAKNLKDGAQVNVPFLTAAKIKQMQAVKALRSQPDFDGEGYEQASGENGLVNINTASAAELMTLPGVGEATAAKIIDYRSKKQFNEIEEIMQVKGIGKAKFAKMRSRIMI